MEISIKRLLSKIIPSTLWREMRLCRILRNHSKTAKVCEDLISRCNGSEGSILIDEIKPKKCFQTDRLIWQYWEQGYSDLPEVIKCCLKSVDKFNSGCEVIRLCKSNLSEYLDLPEFVIKATDKFGRAFFSDLLRTILLNIYGGVWLDVTVLLTSPLSENYFKKDLFLFQRDPAEKHKDYWEKSYAYYFGWSKGFRVNMLSSVLFAHKNEPIINRLCGLMLYFIKEYEELPDYFMFQILFDVLSKGEMAEHNCEIENDCIPHYLMQLCNDNFPYATLKETLAITGIHKLSYKNMDIHRLEQCLRTF